ncbi:hypothetical protein GCM10018963_65480 [Saccharothrix longispora]
MLSAAFAGAAAGEIAAITGRNSTAGLRARTFLFFIVPLSSSCAVPPQSGGGTERASGPSV